MLAQSQYPWLITWILELLHRRTQQESSVVIEGIRVQICPQVFNPIIGRTTQFFIQNMKIHSTQKVLEIGTGSGVIAAAAARVTQYVTATDVNPYAVQCARTTMRLNGVENRINVLLGDLYSPVHEETFDVILFNPPYFNFDAQSWMALAWSAGSNYELLDRFFTDARNVLSRTGEIQILLSSATPLRHIISLIKKAGFKIQVIASRRILGVLERIFLVRLV